MEKQSLLSAVWRHWWVVVLLAVIGGVLGALPAPAKVEEQALRYTAAHTLLVNDAEASSASSAVSPGQVSLFASVGEVPKRAAEQIGYTGNAAELASQVVVAFDSSTGALTVTTVQDSAAQAELVADTFAEVLNGYLAERQDEVYQKRLAASLDRLAKLEKQLNDLTIQVAADPGSPALAAQRDAISRQYSVAFEQNQVLAEQPVTLSFTTLQRAQAVAEAPEGITAPKSRATRGLMGFVAGLALGIGVALLLGRVDRRIRTREQAESLLDMRARALIPKVKGDRRSLVVLSERHDALSDAYRTVRNIVGFIHSGLEPVDRARVTVVVSPGPGEGKTSLAANLAAAFVEAGQRTVAVNTDFRRPRLAGSMTASPPPPLPFVLADLPLLDPKWLLAPTMVPDLTLLDLSSLDGSAGDLARATARVLPQLCETADAIVVDTSPVSSTAEVLEMLPLADVVVLAVRLGITPIEAAQRSIAVLRDLTTAPILLVLTGGEIDKSTYYEYADRRRPAGSRSKSAYAGPERRISGNRTGTAADRRDPATTDSEARAGEHIE